MRAQTIEFPAYSGIRCLMMPFRQGDPLSVPDEYEAYRDIIERVFIRRGDVGYLTIDESVANAGHPHRGARARFGRALHTEAGLTRSVYGWGNTPRWGGGRRVTLEREVRVLLASNVAGTCAVWDAECEDTSMDGDIGDRSASYPYEAARVLGAGEVCEIGILTPHESLPVEATTERQFLRIVSSGVHGREAYFTKNPILGEKGGRG